MNQSRLDTVSSDATRLQPGRVKTIQCSHEDRYWRKRVLIYFEEWDGLLVMIVLLLFIYVHCCAR